ncbi:MAG: hypothetical protein PW788_01670 [Micavibrio sp.]|nr:hypothetical protein [Micavibrio sp.]
MKYLFLLALCLAALQPAFAADKKPPSLDPQVCRQMVAYVPTPDAKVEYQPGVDVHGKPVAGADLNPSPVQVPRVIKFGIDVDVAQYAGIPVPPGQELANVGIVELDTQTGAMNFNGKPMEGDAERAIRALCYTGRPYVPADHPAPQPDKHNQ